MSASCGSVDVLEANVYAKSVSGVANVVYFGVFEVIDGVFGPSDTSDVAHWTSLLA
jgi:hypothetical protein